MDAEAKERDITTGLQHLAAYLDRAAEAAARRFAHGAEPFDRGLAIAYAIAAEQVRNALCGSWLPVDSCPACAAEVTA